MTNLFGFIRKEKKPDIILVICPTWDIAQPPVGLAYLKAYLRQKGYNAKCFDFNIDLYKCIKDKSWWNLNNPELFILKKEFETVKSTIISFIKKWAKQILSEKSKIIGFSLYMSTVNTSLLLAKELKKQQPNIKLIAGGPEATRIKDKIQKENIFDYIIKGEGEVFLHNVVEQIKKSTDIGYTDKFIKDLDFLPFPDYSDFNLSLYTKPYQLPIVTSRGCIGNCTFCADKPLWKIYRYRHAENIYDEIKYMAKKYAVKNFEFVDSTMNGNLKELSKLCDLIIKNRIKIKWSGKAILRKDMNFKLLKKMKQAGCMSLAYGMESGSQTVLNDMGKNIKVEEAEKIIKDAFKAGIDVCCFLIIGYPIETENDFQLTLDFIKRNYKYIKEFDQITGCHIEYNSYLGQNLDRYKIEFKKDGWHSPNSTPTIRKRRLNKVKQFLEILYQKGVEVQR